uniref:Ovule protein n=1 Tax=Mesocestoides corti TaxID=53468 RepID=A0A5K3G004_MESCO
DQWCSLSRRSRCTPPPPTHPPSQSKRTLGTLFANLESLALSRPLQVDLTCRVGRQCLHIFTLQPTLLRSLLLFLSQRLLSD